MDVAAAALNLSLRAGGGEVGVDVFGAVVEQAVVGLVGVEHSLLLPQFPTLNQCLPRESKMLDRHLIFVAGEFARLELRQLVRQEVDDVFNAASVDANVVDGPRLEFDLDEFVLSGFGHDLLLLSLMFIRSVGPFASLGTARHWPGLHPTVHFIRLALLTGGS